MSSGPLNSAVNVAQRQAHLAREFAQAGLTSAVPEARALLMHVLGLNWTSLVLAGGRELTPAELQWLDALSRRRQAREPLQHLLGWTEWGNLTLQVSPAALIPRPETEVLLALAVAALGGTHAPAVLDVGTGTGALALGVKAARPDARVMASDLSPGALALARQNAEHNDLDVEFVHADLLEGVPGTFDLIVSNPPYLPDTDRQDIQPEVRYDPALALYGGPDGLTLARRLVVQAAARLEPGRKLLLELDPRNVDVLAGELLTANWTVTVGADLTGRRRFLSAVR